MTTQAYYSCVIDDHPKFQIQAYLWANCLMALAGVPAASIHFHLAGQRRENELTAWARAKGIRLVPIERFHADHPHCNKLLQLTTFEHLPGDYVVLMDCDTALTAPIDFAALQVDTMAAKPVDCPVPPRRILDRIFRAAGLGEPDWCPTEFGKAVGDGPETDRNNFNGGFYLIRRSLLGTLRPAWIRWAHWCIENKELFESYAVHVDQVSLALALRQLGIAAGHLGREWNFPTHLGLAKEFDCQPRVVHYHDNVDDSFSPRLTGLANVDAAIGRIRATYEQSQREHFLNELLFSARYALRPELGSGLGSRGDALRIKHRALETLFLGYRDKSVLDVGCGDLEVGGKLPAGRYTGVDIAETAISLARGRFPDRTFLRLDARKEPLPHADVVMCLDVLIHQTSRADFDALLDNLIQATGETLIVGAHENPPQLTSAIVTFHTPITQALAESGQFDEIATVATYRDVAMVVAKRRRTGPRHPRDIAAGDVNAAARLGERPDLLRLAVDTARQALGFFPAHMPRTLEYPWILSRLLDSPLGERHIVDIGAGVCPVPLLLARAGAQVVTLDQHPTTRTLDTRDSWNEWGFLDYGTIEPGIRSLNMPAESYTPAAPVDVVYSISVVEHLPRTVRAALIKRIGTWTRAGGSLLLTVDLEPGGDRLWNRAEGKIVDRDDDHGSVADLLDEIAAAGFSVIETKEFRAIPDSNVDVLCLHARRNSSASSHNPLHSAKPMDNNTALIVLGMHRSGTSALTGVLAALGADAGPDLQGGNEFNPRGYWEHRDVVRIHDELLAKLGSAWNDPRPLPPDWQQGEAAAAARQALLAVLRRDFGASRLWLVKDPRLCRLLPLWLDVLADMGVSPRFVIASRHPAAVAASLAARDGMPVARALLLWLQHLTDAELHSRGHRRVAVAYEDLMRDWRATAGRVAAALAVPLTLDEPAAAETVADFLSPALRHHDGRRDDAAAPTALENLATAAFAALSATPTSEALAVALEEPRRLAGLLAEVAPGGEPAAAAAAAPTTATPATEPAADLAPLVAEIDAELARLAAPAAPPAPAAAEAPPVPLPPLEEEQRYQRALARIAAGERPQAIELLAALAERQSMRWEIYNDLGSLLLEEGRTDEAIAALRTAASLELASTDSLRNLAAACVAAGDLGQLLVVCHQLLKQAPEDQDLILFLRDVVLAADMRFDDYAWLSPAVAALPARLEELTRREAALAAENRFLKAKSRFFDQVAQPLRDREAARRAAAMAAQASSIDHARLLFVHIPKTAGISFFSALEDIFGTDRCVRFMMGGKADLPAYRAIPDDRLRGLAVLGGHMSLPQFDERDIRERRVLAVFRDPIDRFLSEYSYIRGWQEHPLHNTIGAMTLEQYVDYLAEDVKRANNQCWYVCGKGDFESARQMIDKRFFLVAPLERLPEFCAELSWRLDLPAIALPEKNRTEQRLRIDDVEPRILERMRQIAKDDIQLVDYVRERFDLAARQGKAEREAATADAPSRGLGLNGWHKINALSDEAWLDTLIKSVEVPSYQGFPLPTFPPERMQIGIMGSSNETGLREGFRYYKMVKGQCAAHGNPLTAESRLLDFGTGWGRYPRIFLKDIRPENIVGVDVDQSLVDLCRNSFPYGRFETVPAFPPTELPANHFHLITAYSVFSHLSEPAATAWIKEFARILAPGGMIAVTTQGRSFLDFCEDIRRTGGDSQRPWHKKLAASFVDADACRAAYDRGEFLFEATGGGEVRPSTFYGEALVPEGFVTRVWSQYLEPLAFIDDRAQLPQALIVMRKKA